MIVAVVGSRKWADEEAVREYVRHLPEDVQVVSGGAKGPDSWGVSEAIRTGRRWRIHPANWRAFGMAAGKLRNYTIVLGSAVDLPGMDGVHRWPKADCVAAFWDGKSSGTKHSVELARSAQIPVEEFRMHGHQLGLRLFGVVS